MVMKLDEVVMLNREQILKTAAMYGAIAFVYLVRLPVVRTMRTVTSIFWSRWSRGAACLIWADS